MAPFMKTAIGDSSPHVQQPFRGPVALCRLLLTFVDSRALSSAHSVLSPLLAHTRSSKHIYSKLKIKPLSTPQQPLHPHSRHSHRTPVVALSGSMMPRACFSLLHPLHPCCTFGSQLRTSQPWARIAAWCHIFLL